MENYIKALTKEININSKDSLVFILPFEDSLLCNVIRAKLRSCNVKDYCFVYQGHENTEIIENYLDKNSKFIFILDGNKSCLTYNLLQGFKNSFFENRYYVFQSPKVLEEMGISLETFLDDKNKYNKISSDLSEIQIYRLFLKSLSSTELKVHYNNICKRINCISNGIELSLMDSKINGTIEASEDVIIGYIEDSVYKEAKIIGLRMYVDNKEVVDYIFDDVIPLNEKNKKLSMENKIKLYKVIDKILDKKELKISSLGMIDGDNTPKKYHNLYLYNSSNTYIKLSSPILDICVPISFPNLEVTVQSKEIDEVKIYSKKRISMNKKM